jgi:hypothetical protein
MSHPAGRMAKDHHAVLSEGKPVYIDDQGKEVAFDYPATLATITRLNGEAKGHRERAEKAEGTLKAFEGITDPAAALKALGIVKNLDDKKLVDAGEVEKVKAEAIKAVEEKYSPITQERDRLRGDLYAEKIGGAFARSKFINDKIAIPSDLMQARFGGQFEIKDGKVLAKDQAGNPIYSKARPGEHADFEEALELLVDAYPQKDHILKGTNGSGGGARPGAGGAGGADLSKLTPVERINAARGTK